jgi:hypothetical protein
LAGMLALLSAWVFGAGRIAPGSASRHARIWVGAVTAAADTGFTRAFGGGIWAPVFPNSSVGRASDC